MCAHICKLTPSPQGNFISLGHHAFLGFLEDKPAFVTNGLNAGHTQHGIPLGNPQGWATLEL